ncbi:hypothetical protein [Geminocystis sp. NIES-3709]|uniref:hypothetical protein n=1 Tax=Geminocystis sp. NIES-3709 TaxID=1617448 RepID=UPI0005FCDA20|nr:hypothetical protein [Geminocystis sp. NIES-3709]BAQ67066.1 hypothetical protein GM3709_3831 [Geminocystis sp. NIES-3709]
MANLQLTDNSIQSGTAQIKTYLRHGLNIPVNPVQEYILIDTGFIPSGNSKIIDLALLGYPVAINTIWTLSEAQPTRGGVTVQIVRSADTGVALHEFELSGDCACMTLPFLVLDSRYKLKITPDNNVDNILIYAYQVVKIDYLGITDSPTP